jgi:hypothetical protein
MAIVAVPEARSRENQTETILGIYINSVISTVIVMTETLKMEGGYLRRYSDNTTD